MSTYRTVDKVVSAMETSEGNGARVKRSIGIKENYRLDPFLLLDEFYVQPPAGFPEHPHRGFETVTYMLDGKFTHKDNKGHQGTISPGEVQWMTAGKGIVHSEMPATPNVNHGLQLWVNLKSNLKMIDPNYQDVTVDKIPTKEEDGVKVRIIAGESLGLASTTYTRTPSMYLHFTLQPGKSVEQAVPYETAFIYVLNGEVVVGTNEDSNVGKVAQLLVLSTKGQKVRITSPKGGDFVVISGTPLNEPVAQRGPFVMNTAEELDQAVEDYFAGKF